MKFIILIVGEQLPLALLLCLVIVRIMLGLSLLLHALLNWGCLSTEYGLMLNVVTHAKSISKLLGVSIVLEDA